MVENMRRKKSESVTWKSIKGWVEFGQGLPVAEPKPMEEWKHIQEFLREGKKILASERKRMRGLLKSSCAKFRPLHDPLQAELGTHRWLAHEREESYSDWMKWILEQISDPRRIGKVMGVKEKSLSRFSGKIRIDREVGIKDMEGNRRRTDLDISYGETDAFRVEIKKGMRVMSIPNNSRLKSGRGSSNTTYLLFPQGKRVITVGGFPFVIGKTYV